LRAAHIIRKGNEMYEKLEKWAANHNMQFKVNVFPGRAVGYAAEVWLSDKCDGFCGAECCNIYPDGSVSWMGYRFRLRKNEEFIDRFVNEFMRQKNPIGTEDWIGYDDSPVFVLPTFWKSTNGTRNGIKGTFYWLDKLPEDITAMIESGCELLKSHPAYAPELVSDVVFVPKGVRISYC